MNPVFCEHANESPRKCPCPDTCYCKYNTCSARYPPTAERGTLANSKGHNLMRHIFTIWILVIASLVGLVACSGESGTPEPVASDTQALCPYRKLIVIDAAWERPGGTCGTWIGRSPPLFELDTQVAYGDQKGHTCFYAQDPQCIDFRSLYFNLLPAQFYGHGLCFGYPDVAFNFDFAYTEGGAKVVHKWNSACDSIYDLQTHATY